MVVSFAQRMYGGSNSFILLALPLFMFAGALMESGGISDRLVRLGMVFLGWIRGGLSMVVVAATMFFSGISGSASSDTAAVGGVLIPAMKKRGYPVEYAAAVAAASGALGPIIPPSILLVVYGGMANVSIAKLFVGGLGPGILFGVLLILACWINALRHNYPKEGRSTVRQALAALYDALIPLATPAIILGGIFSGLFTATESAAVAVAYALIVSLYIYRSLTWNQVFDIAVESVLTSAQLMFVVASAGFASWVLAREQIPQQVAESVLSFSSDPIVLLIIINGLLLLFGCVLEGMAITVILLPTLLPIVEAAGIDLVFFGVLMMVNLSIGAVTPPIGTCLFVAASIAKVPVERVIPYLWSFILVMVIGLATLIAVPGVVLWLPNMM